MRKAIVLTLALLGAQLPLPAVADEPTAYNVLLAGGSASNVIQIWLTADGRNYVIDSIVPLEVGGTICQHATGNPNELVCEAVQVGAFEVNADGGDDTVRLAHGVTIPVTMRGGTGRDILVGGSAADKLIGGPGPDRIAGKEGNDLLIGGEGYDAIFGGPGNDRILGGPGHDTIIDGPGADVVHEPGYPVRKRR